MTRTSVDITIPVLNEAGSVVSSVTTLAAYLDTQCPYDWSITVADNGSTDQTLELATSFATLNPRMRVIRLEERGRGGALKEAWSTSTAEVVAYMDVDLSTGLESLRPLLDPIVDGSCEVSIGSRLSPGAQIVRSLRREVISRIYNLIARAFLHYDIIDAQCGFKAIRTSLARELIPKIEDNGWFFDTELLALAHRMGRGSTRYRCVGSRTTTPGSRSLRPRPMTSKGSGGFGGMDEGKEPGRRSIPAGLPRRIFVPNREEEGDVGSASTRSATRTLHLCPAMARRRLPRTDFAGGHGIQFT